MKSLKKFETFEDLKSAEKKNVDYSSSLKKHNEFEEFIKLIKASALKNNQSK